jgi:hypothetical protein
MLWLSQEAPGVYRIVVNGIDCLAAIGGEADRRWLLCADVVVDQLWALPLAALVYASGIPNCPKREATSSARGSHMES